MKDDPLKDISTELWLMLACAIGDKTKIQKILCQPVNWDTFIKLAVHHRVYPLVYKTINQIKNLVVPQYVINDLHQKYSENIYQSLTMAGETFRIVKCFENHGIRVLVLKGAPLAWRLYSNLACRLSRDIDILVEPKQFKEAQELLENEGYYNIHPEYDINSQQKLKILRSYRHFVYRHIEKNIVLELHWDLGYSLTMPTDNDIRILEVSGNPIPVLTDEMCFIYLMLHGTRHAWYRLGWLVDIAKFIQEGNINWENLRTKLNKNSELMQSSFHQGLILATHFFDVPIPPNFQSVLKNDLIAWQLSYTAINICLSTADNVIKDSDDWKTNYYWKIYYNKMQIGWKNKLNYNYLRYFRPSLNDFNLISLPDSLYSLYFIIRPFTWLSKFFKKFNKMR